MRNCMFWRRLKRSLWMIPALLLCCLIVGCSPSAEAPAYASSEDLYEIGLELISTMEEMIQSNEYAKIMVVPESIADMAAQMDAGNYDTPVAVYSVSALDVKDFLSVMDAETADLWRGLSNDLKDQLEQRVSLSTVITAINNARGTNCTAFSNLYIAVDQVDSLRIRENLGYWYVFEPGISIFVSFNQNGSISGQFVFVEDAVSLEAVEAAFGYGVCKVKEVSFEK